MFQGMGRPEERQQSEHTPLSITFAILFGAFHGAPKPITIGTQSSLMTDHPNKYNNKKVWNTVRITKTWQRHKVSQCRWTNGTDRLARCTKILGITLQNLIRVGPPHPWGVGSRIPTDTHIHKWSSPSLKWHRTTHAVCPRTCGVPRVDGKY